MNTHDGAKADATTSDFGDRHLRPDPGGKLHERLMSSHARVRVTVSEDVARTRAGQLGAWLCVNLLARLDGLVHEIELNVPEVAAHPSLLTLYLGTPEWRPHTPRVGLRQALADLCATASGNRVQANLTVPDAAVTFQIVIGCGRLAVPPAERTVWCFGSGWRAYMGEKPPSVGAPQRSEDNPLGIYLAVCYAVAEAFKAIRGLKPEARAEISEIFTSVWTGKNASTWGDLEDGPVVDTLRVSAAYLVGAGAVGQAAAFVISTATLGSDYVTIVDGEDIDNTNRNRYILSATRDEGGNKAALIESFLRAHGIPAFASGVHWTPYLTRPDPHPNPAFSFAEAQLKFPLVLSCVDTNTARHELQRTWPLDIIGGSTEGLRIQVTHYDLRTQTACLACHNPIPDFERGLSSLRQGLSALPRDQQRARLVELGIAPEKTDAVLSYLEKPKCGELGEQELRKFVDQGPIAFSVGFVSFAAGLFVTRHWIRHALGGPSDMAPPTEHYLTLNFYNGRSMWSEQSANPACFCQSGGRAVWASLWT